MNRRLGDSHESSNLREGGGQFPEVWKTNPFLQLTRISFRKRSSGIRGTCNNAVLNNFVDLHL